MTVRAVRLTTPLRIDGQLDEEVYASVPAMTDFIQNDPREGAPATEKTDVWIFFDRQNVYVVAKCWETDPTQIVANEMRRDGQVFQDDNFAFMFDTFFDRRNGIVFEISASGGRFDGQVTNERQVNRDWNPVWDLKVGRFPGGWTMEAALPFKSLRYRPGQTQIWGFNARRFNRRKNEVSYLTPIAAVHGRTGHFRSSLAATVVGIESPANTRILEIKPYVIASVTSDVNAKPRLSNDPGGDIGLDVKYGITQNLAADFTYRTDFAQVEADEQQVNLTRFNLSFPEKREFFLENQGIFTFGGATGGGGGGGTNVGVSANNQSDAPQLFYSRRIGLNGAREVPLIGGGRLTGRVGRYSVGALNVESDDEAVSGVRATNFSVVRVKRDVLRRSSVGALFTGRSVGASGTGTNQTYGVDGILALSDTFAVNAYWAQTQTTSLAKDNQSYRAQLDYNADRYGVQLERLSIDDHFNPEAGFVRRDNMRKNFGEFRFSPRPRRVKGVRKLFFATSLNHVQNDAGRLETRTWDGEFVVDLQNSDRLIVGRNANYEYLSAAFPIATGVTLPVGGYDFGETRLGYNFGRQRKVSGNVLVTRGTFYDGHKTAFTVSQGRTNVTGQFSIEPTYSLNTVDLVEGSFTNHLVGSRVNFTMTPLMFTSALIQYNSATKVVSANVRLRWEYQPGSELFVVFNEQRDAFASGFPTMTNRAFIVKINRLFRP